MNLITITNETAVLDPVFCAQFAELEKQIKVLTEKEKAIKTEIMRAMEAYGVITIDNDELTISYIAGTDRETFDSKAFKEDFPEIYDTYIKLSSVAASIRVKVK